MNLSLLRKSFLIFTLTISIPCTIQAQLRTFTSNQGATIQGEIIEWHENRVKVRRQDNAVVDIPFSLLEPGQAEALAAEAETRMGFRKAPEVSDIRLLIEESRKEGPSKVANRLWDRLASSYPANRETCEGWLFLYRWFDFIAVAQEYSYVDTVTSAWPEDLLISMLGDQELSRQFFTLIQDSDKPAVCAEILLSLYQQFPEAFPKFTGLALAIALVHDSSPPKHWPHSQVSEVQLERKLQPADQVFRFFVDSQNNGKLENNLTRLPLQELIFLVDIIAPIPELEWAQENVKERSAQFERIYSGIRYDKARVDFANGNFRPDWSHASYSLETIRSVGGICVDQGYFAWQAGKAKGIPTIIFSGAGNDGAHAWVGFYDANRGWNLDVGRYSQGQYVTGRAFSPQDWSRFKDHELLFMRERFRSGSKFLEAIYHLEMARQFFRHEQYAQTERALETTLNIEPRNPDAWEIRRNLARETQGFQEEKKVLEEAAQALSRYPDWVNYFRMELARWYIEQNQPDEAFDLWQRLARVQLRDRPDLAISNAAIFLADSRRRHSQKEFEKTSRRVLTQFGRQTPEMIVVRELLIPVCNDFLRERNPQGATGFIETFRQVFRPQPNSFINDNLVRIEQFIRYAQ